MVKKFRFVFYAPQCIHVDRVLERLLS